jgi:hypothetical protein
MMFIKPDSLFWRQFAFQDGIVMGRATIGFTEEFDTLFFIG